MSSIPAKDGRDGRDGPVGRDGRDANSDKLDEATARMNTSMAGMDESMHGVDDAMAGISRMAEATVKLAASNRELAASNATLATQMEASTEALKRRAKGNARLTVIAIILILVVAVGVYRANTLVSSVKSTQRANKQTLALITTATSEASQEAQAKVLTQTILCLENHSDINAAKLQHLPPVPLRAGCPSP